MFQPEVNRLQHALDYSLKMKRKVFIYVIKCHEFYKIGISDNPRARMCLLQIGNPYKLHLMRQWETLNPKADEDALHARFEEYYQRGEWFAIPPKILTPWLATKNKPKRVKIMPD